MDLALAHFTVTSEPWRVTSKGTPNDFASGIAVRPPLAKCACSRAGFSRLALA
jgi:hypothetical protein